MQKCENTISEPTCSLADSEKKTNIYISLAAINQEKITEEEKPTTLELNSPKVKYLVRYKPQ